MSPDGIVVRAWSSGVFGVYLTGAGHHRLGDFVGVVVGSRDEAMSHGEAMRGEATTLSGQNRCGTTDNTPAGPRSTVADVRELEGRGRHTASTPNPAKTSHRPAELR